MKRAIDRGWPFILGQVAPVATGLIFWGCVVWARYYFPPGATPADFQERVAVAMSVQHALIFV